ncbi:MAG: DNA repair protein RadA [Myxococcota bacterium]
MAKKGKKAGLAYECSACGARHSRWLGRCPTCQEWNTLEEVGPAPSTSAVERSGGSRRPVRVADVDTDDARRLPTGIGELDRALGGGPVAGGVILLGGDPGIGKSTLLMQAVAALAKAGHRVLYVSGEESASQIALRARRLAAPGVDEVRLLATTELEDAAATLEGKERPQVMVVDSIQTLRSNQLASAPGSVTQLREVTARLVDLAKRHGVALFLIGHVTKDGALAGPKVLEHLVDTVLSFEGDRSHAFRLVRAVKNRFGPAQEVGVFEMVREGLREVPDPSALFLAERPERASGSVVVPTAEGSRPLLVELQALVAPASYGSARRVVSGLDGSRLAILLAVLERRAGVRLHDRDVFASVAGGARAQERALDLALAAAIVSSARDLPVPSDVAVLGEVGLAGEVRAVPRVGPRLQEVAKMGFARVVLPRANVDGLTKRERELLSLAPVRSLDEALRAALES